MKKLAELMGFVVGCALLAAGFGVGWLDLGRLGDRAAAMRILIAAILVVVAFLAVMAGKGKGKDRWRALLLDGILILGLGALYFDIGLITLIPVGLVLLVLSSLKLNSHGQQVRPE